MLTTLRRTRLSTALIALISLLFMQLALANYVCPGAAKKIAVVAAMAEAGMPCAGAGSITMDDAQPNLCQAHCQADPQSADTYQLPSVVAIDAVLAVFPPSLSVPVLLGAPLQAPLLRRSTVPALAVRNCCFRI